MDESYIRKRITELRMKKKVSEYRMSKDMGHNKGYIHKVVKGPSLPPLSEFLYMCEYLGVTPMQFFDADTENPALLNEAAALMKNMGEDDFKALIALLSKHMNQDKE